MALRGIALRARNANPFAKHWKKPLHCIALAKNKMKENEKLIISVKAHEKTRYKDYVAVIDQLKTANAKRISIAETAD